MFCFIVGVLMISAEVGLCWFY